MGTVHKFSEIDRVIKETDAQGCISDTSALIAFTYTPSEFSEDAEFAFGKLEELKLPSFVNVSTSWGKGTPLSWSIFKSPVKTTLP